MSQNANGLVASHHSAILDQHAEEMIFSLAERQEGQLHRMLARGVLAIAQNAHHQGPRELECPGASVLEGNHVLAHHYGRP